jgi:hypothetical protein
MMAHTINALSRRRRRIRRRNALALALGICALAIPSTAGASPVDPSASTSSVSGSVQQHAQTTGMDPVPGPSYYGNPPPGADLPGVPASSSGVALRRDGSETVPFIADVGTKTSASTGGFNWGDAGIGAGAALALTMIGLGDLLVLSNRRHRAEKPAATA